MPPRFAAMKTYKGYNGGAAKGSLLHNDDSIFGGKNRPDLNAGGGPSGRKVSASSSDRTGAGTRFSGRDHAPSTSLRGRGGSGNPGASAGSRGGVGGSLGAPAEGRQSFTPDTRISGHGGSPQHREREIPGDFHKRGGVGAHGQEFVPGGRQSNVQRMGGGVTTPGNVGGTTYRQIKGRFTRRAMGARPSGQESRGQYGSAPVTENT